MQNGFGEEEWPDGGKYCGRFLNGAREGKGKLTFADKAFYEGGFVKGEISGYGVY